MAKTKGIYTCDACGAQHLKWQGQCPDCGKWNALSETQLNLRKGSQGSSRALSVESTRLDSLDIKRVERSGSGLSELDRVLGGGLVPGSVVLIGGDPGIGKSTLLLSVVASVSKNKQSCYVTGEESLDQIALRAARLGVDEAPVRLYSETCVETVIETLRVSTPQVLVIDSIQTLFSEQLGSAPGSVAQLRECAAQLVRFAKDYNVATVLVGHVTKEGVLAGPRVLEHMVDTVLYFESDLGSRFRILRSAKNRFGAANELGFFVMGEEGFKEVKNPSAIFLSRRTDSVPGSVTLVTRESSRSLLVEVQALVDENLGTSPRRLAQGLDSQRLALLLAVLHRHSGIGLSGHDVFTNVVGGLRVLETAADLAVCLATLSSYNEKAIPANIVVFGEVGLTGEIRPVPYGEERLAEAKKYGFEKAIVPVANIPQNKIGMEIFGVEKLGEVLNILS
ncbi:MAG: DNA repair protein RadA [Gammaproteobacteria bacterium]|nr:DNA repair protein RadA [Gammaproteobacteria bacterium]|tara:strand:+ start:3366 stop:4715 length:1350 start_codon:yes stop_codon:yes gene_type:complete